MASLQNIFQTRIAQDKHKVTIIGHVHQKQRGDIYNKNSFKLETWLRELPTFSINPQWKQDAADEALEKASNHIASLGRAAAFAGAVFDNPSLSVSQFRIKNQTVSSITWQGTAEISIKVPILFINLDGDPDYYEETMKSLLAFSMPTSFSLEDTLTKILTPTTVNRIANQSTNLSQPASEAEGVNKEAIDAAQNNKTSRDETTDKRSLIEDIYKNGFSIRAPLGTHYLQIDPFNDNSKGTVSIQIGTMFKATGLVCDGMEITHEQLDVEGKPQFIEGSMNFLFIRQPTYQEFIKFFDINANPVSNELIIRKQAGHYSSQINNENG